MLVLVVVAVHSTGFSSSRPGPGRGARAGAGCPGAAQEPSVNDDEDVLVDEPLGLPLFGVIGAGRPAPGRPAPTRERSAALAVRASRSAGRGTGKPAALLRGLQRIFSPGDLERGRARVAGSRLAAMTARVLVVED